MLGVITDAAGVAGVLVWVWLIPNALEGRPLLWPPRWLRYALPLAADALTWTRRRRARRRAIRRAQRAAFWQARNPWPQVLTYTGPRLPEGFLMASTSNPVSRAFVQLVDAGMTPRAAREALGYNGPGLPPGHVPAYLDRPSLTSPSGWAPSRIAAMPRDRCGSCPVWGCLGGGDLTDGQIVDCEYKVTPPHGAHGFDRQASSP